MCCLFGILNYGQKLGERQRKKLLNSLAAACEARGTDASGIAYNSCGSLRVYKRPLPAHLMRFAVPSDSRVIMGHTRLTTQGDEKRNYNNHPFFGTAGDTGFALAHNGIIYNDLELRKTKPLPVPLIETDSYVAVQLLEKQGTLNFSTLKSMAEDVRGSFTFTVLDKEDNLYIVKGDSPICLCRWEKHGLYVYASTGEILSKALKSAGRQLGRAERIPVNEGDILKIDRFGRISRERFEFKRSDFGGVYKPYAWDIYGEEEYINDLKSVCTSFGYLPEEVDLLLESGFAPEEIEECFYKSADC